jgi:hypothetical protein
MKHPSLQRDDIIGGHFTEKHAYITTEFYSAIDVEEVMELSEKQLVFLEKCSDLLPSDVLPKWFTGAHAKAIAEEGLKYDQIREVDEITLPILIAHPSTPKEYLSLTWFEKAHACALEKGRSYYEISELTPFQAEFLAYGVQLSRSDVDFPAFSLRYVESLVHAYRKEVNYLIESIDRMPKKRARPQADHDFVPRRRKQRKYEVTNETLTSEYDRDWKLSEEQLDYMSRVSELRPENVTAEWFSEKHVEVLEAGIFEFDEIKGLTTQQVGFLEELWEYRIRHKDVSTDWFTQSHVDALILGREYNDLVELSPTAASILAFDPRLTRTELDTWPSLDDDGVAAIVRAHTLWRDRNYFRDLITS